MPTGSGKSLTYQLAAMLRPEPTLVLSPLIALMKDQVDKLPREIAATATFVNSSLEPGVAAQRIADVAAGRTRLLYAAPERLRNAAFVDTLRTIGVGLVVIDEVHCVSMWGHDFRPDYLFIRRALEELGDPTVLGMTATATPTAATEIAAALGRNLAVVRTSIVRPNLRYDVEEVAGNEDRLRILVERLRATPGRKRHRLRTVTRLVRARRPDTARARPPHGALSRRPRERRPLADPGRLRQGRSAASSRQPRSAWVSTSRTSGSSASSTIRIHSSRTSRWWGAPGETVHPARRSCSRARPTRPRCADSPRGHPGPDDLRRVYRVIRDLGGTVDPGLLPAATTIRASSSACSSKPASSDAGTTPAVRCGSTCPLDPGAGGVVEELLERYAREAKARVERIVRFAETRSCRHAQVAAALR